TSNNMATKNSAVFLLGLLLSCVAMSSAARILEETVPSKEEHQPEVPPLPKVELPPFPEVHLPPKPEVELPTFPEVHLPPKPEMPTVPGFHLPEPEAKP
uniref:Uncharacterized protein n=1 Tax=Aegilops tauschii subsp. strangulata TaxID=200361 RepID=A0A453B5P0_AEGTS